MRGSLDNPGNRELREFAAILGVGLPVAFGLALPFFGSGDYPVWPWVAGAIFLGWGALAPASLRPLLLLWLGIARAIGRVATPMILASTWLLAIVPTGLIMRMLRNDPMRRTWDPDVETYRRPSDVRPPSHQERPF
jgi:hypothetical protein